MTLESLRPCVLSVLLVGSAASCTESHTDCSVDAADAASSDYGRDEGRPDGRADSGADSGADLGPICPPVCPDADGDGHLAASCGGDDCDDARAELYPTHPACTGGIRDSCDGTSTDHENCGDGVCSPTLGRCVAVSSGCGDGVVSGTEGCDDGNLEPHDGCTPDCALECQRTADCPSSQACMSWPANGGVPVCRPRRGSGGPTGSACTTSNDCTDAPCDLLQRRCSARCTTDADCSGAWCPATVAGGRASGSAALDYTACQYACHRTSDCPADRRCVEAGNSIVGGMVVEYTTCSAAAGTLPAGAFCSFGAECEDGACTGRCESFCASNADCPSSAPMCVPSTGAIFSDDGTPVMTCV